MVLERVVDPVGPDRDVVVLQRLDVGQDVGLVVLVIVLAVMLPIIELNQLVQ